VATTEPPPLTEDFATPNRPRIPPPKESFDFLPDLQEKKGDGFKLRDDIKPLHVLQPEGVSFKMDGHVLTWQKWLTFLFVCFCLLML
jgi:primary-amine oxidase